MSKHTNPLHCHLVTSSKLYNSANNFSDNVIKIDVHSCLGIHVCIFLQTLDQQQLFTEDELKEFESHISQQEDELRKKAEDLQKQKEELQRQHDQLQAQKQELQQVHLGEQFFFPFLYTYTDTVTGNDNPQLWSILYIDFSCESHLSSK